MQLISEVYNFKKGKNMDNLGSLFMGAAIGAALLVGAVFGIIGLIIGSTLGN